MAYVLNKLNSLCDPSIKNKNTYYLILKKDENHFF